MNPENQTMKTNRYSGPCAICGATVPANGGTLERVGNRWKVSHLACKDSGESRVVTFRFQGDSREYYQNARGRCEDAPCCGCCNI